MAQEEQLRRRKPLTKRQRARLVAGKEPIPAYNLRSIIMWIIAGLVIAAAIYFFVNRETILAVASDDTKIVVETCTVTKVNATREFNTDCGRFYWGEKVGTSPYGLIGVGKTYEFSGAGPRFPLFGLKPTIVDYKEVAK